MKIKFHNTYPDVECFKAKTIGDMVFPSNVGKPTTGQGTCKGVTRLQVLGECDGVFRMVQGIVGKTSKEREESRDKIANDVFADVLAGQKPDPRTPPTHDPRKVLHPDINASWKTSIDGKVPEDIPA